MRRPVRETFTLAGVSLHETDMNRNFHFAPRPSRIGVNWEGHRIASIQTILHTPKDPHRDPFLVALVIALAQRERRHAVQPLPPNSSFTVSLCVFSVEITTVANLGVVFQVRMLFTGMVCPKNSVNLYVAHVQAAFLDRFDFSKQQPAVDSGLDIDYWHIPHEPLQTLPDRFCQALRPEGYGKTHGRKREGHEAKGSGADEHSGEAGQKREREVAWDEGAQTLKRTSV